jgi:hypothetical protein
MSVDFGWSQLFVKRDQTTGAAPVHELQESDLRIDVPRKGPGATLRLADIVFSEYSNSAQQSQQAL